MKRNTPLNRTNGLNRGKPMNHRSPKRKRQDIACNHLKEFAAQWIGTPCWLCLEEGNMGFATEVHHIAGRSHRLRHHRANLAPLCKQHHENVTRWQVREMFEVKKKYDPEGYDVAVAALVYRGKSGRRDL